MRRGARRSSSRRRASGSTAANPVLFDALSQGEPWRRAITRRTSSSTRRLGAGLGAPRRTRESAPLFPPELPRALPSPDAGGLVDPGGEAPGGGLRDVPPRADLGLRRDAALVAAATFVSAGFLQLWRTHALASVAAMTPWLFAAGRPSREAPVPPGTAVGSGSWGRWPSPRVTRRRSCTSAGLTSSPSLPSLLLALRAGGSGPAASAPSPGVRSRRPSPSFSPPRLSSRFSRRGGSESWASAMRGSALRSRTRPGALRASRDRGSASRARRPDQRDVHGLVEHRRVRAGGRPAPPRSSSRRRARRSFPPAVRSRMARARRRGAARVGARARSLRGRRFSSRGSVTRSWTGSASGGSSPPRFSRGSARRPSSAGRAGGGPLAGGAVLTPSSPSSR